LRAGKCAGSASRPQMPEPGQPCEQLAAAVAEADQGALHLVEVPPGVVTEGMPPTGREGPQAGAQLVAVRPDGLERRAAREADLALDAVDLDGGGEPVAVLVDALGDAHAAARGRLGAGRLGRRAAGAGFADGGVHRLSPHGRVLAVHLTWPTGAGKTTLLNALVSLLPAAGRVISIEDTLELCLRRDNGLRFEARGLGDRGVTIRDLVRHALRHRPDHIVVGEVRGAEAADLLQALNTGHGGSLATVHANNAAAALSRLATCAMQASDALPWTVVCRGVVDGIEAVIHQTRTPEGGRRVDHMVRVRDYDASEDRWVVERVWPQEAAADLTPAPKRPAVSSKGRRRRRRR